MVNDTFYTLFSLVFWLSENFLVVCHSVSVFGEDWNNYRLNNIFICLVCGWYRMKSCFVFPTSICWMLIDLSAFNAFRIYSQTNIIWLQGLWSGDGSLDFKCLEVGGLRGRGSMSYFLHYSQKDRFWQDVKTTLLWDW